MCMKNVSVQSSDEEDELHGYSSKSVWPKVVKDLLKGLITESVLNDAKNVMKRGSENEAEHEEKVLRNVKKKPFFRNVFRKSGKFNYYM